MVRDGVINLIAKIEFLDGSRDSIELSMKDAKEIEETLAEQEDQLKKIVRCKDCKRRGTYDCPVYVGGDGMYSEPDDWFCADGERKKGR